MNNILSKNLDISSKRGRKNCRINRSFTRIL